MRTLIATLCVAMLVCAPASAQMVRRNPQVGVQTPMTVQAPNVPGESILDGSWTIGVLIPGRLTMHTGANGVLSGELNTSGSGDYSCSGRHHGAEFMLLCPIGTNAVLFAGIARADPPVATQRSALVGDRSRLSGKVYLSQFGATGVTPGDLLATPLIGSPAS